MHPIIIIEGPDACGKTTWCEAYKKLFGARYMHLALHENLFAYQVMSLVRAVKLAENTPVLIDRHWPSEQIYGSVYRGVGVLVEEAEWLDRVCGQLGIFYVLALGDSVDQMVEWHAESEKSRAEMYEPSEKYRQVVQGYWDFWHGSRECPVEVGQCHKRAPLCERYMAAYRYNRAECAPGKETLQHASGIHWLARAWRKFAMVQPRSLRLANERETLIRECGYHL